MKLSQIFLGLSAVVLGAQANAAIVVQYGTAGSTTSLAPVIADSGVTADNLEAGPGIDVNNFSTFNFGNWDPANTSFADAVADDEFWTFGFDALTDISLTTMDIRLDRSSTGPDDFEIRATVNGANEVSILTHDYNDSGAGVNFLDVDLSVIGALSAGDSVEFVLAAFNAESTAGTFDLETITFPDGTDGITINGEISAIPVPAAAWLFGSALCGLTIVRKKNSQSKKF